MSFQGQWTAGVGLVHSGLHCDDGPGCGPWMKHQGQHMCALASVYVCVCMCVHIMIAGLSNSAFFVLRMLNYFVRKVENIL